MDKHSTGKIGLVLAGGGITGAVYEIGALRAIDDLLVDRTVNDFDIYVGTSAGAFVSTLLANGQSPENMKVLEARTQNCGKARRDKLICKLNRTLAELELALGNMDPTILQGM